MVAALSATLNQDQFRVLVGISLPGWLQDECDRLKVKTRGIPLAGAFHVQWFKTCFHLVRNENVALIHAHEFGAILYGWIIARLTGIPFIGTIHGKNYFWGKAATAYGLSSNKSIRDFGGSFGGSKAVCYG